MSFVPALRASLLVLLLLVVFLVTALFLAAASAAGNAPDRAVTAPLRETACVTARADTYIISNDPDSNHESESDLRLAAGGSYSSTVLLDFQLPESIPPNATILSATVGMDMLWSEFSEAPSTLQAIDDTWKPYSVSWNNQPPMSGSYDNPTHDDSPGRKRWQARQLVQKWLDGRQVRWGLAIAGRQERVLAAFASRELTGYQPPELCIAWAVTLPDAQEAALARLREASGEAVDVRFEDGQVRFLSARVPVAGYEDPVAAALYFLEEYAELYGLTAPGEQLYLDAVRALDGEGVEQTAVVFGQRLGDLPVYGANLVVYLEGETVTGSLGHYLVGRQPLLNIENGDPRLVPAINAARESLGAAESELTGEPELVLFNPRLLFGDAYDGSARYAEATPAWLVPLRSWHEEYGPGEWKVLVEVKSGDVLFAQSGIQEQVEKNKFDVRNDGPALNAFCGTIGTEHWFDNDGPTDNYPGGPGSYPGGDADADTAYQELQVTYDYWWNTFRRMGHKNKKRNKDRLIVHTDSPNAHYSQRCNNLNFSDNWVTDDVLAHEYAHGVTHFESNLEYVNQSGALNESFSDLFAALITNDWTIMESAPGSSQRELSDPPSGTPAQPDHMNSSISGDGTGLRTTSSPECDRSKPGWNDCGFVHTNSGIPNLAGYLLVEGGVHPGSGIEVEGLGATRGGSMFYAAVRRLSSTSNFRDMRDTMIDIARDRSYPVHTICQTINAYAAVGVGNPDTDCDGRSNLPGSDGDGDNVIDQNDNCPNIYNLNQVDADGDGLGDDCDGDADGDNVANDQDNCPLVANANQRDDDNNGVGYACDDLDDDGVLNPTDNCPTDANALQLDADGDGDGDACDLDADNDGLLNSNDNCALTYNPGQADADGDGVGDACDNCPNTDNPGQANHDTDEQGDACDADDDDDGVLDFNDNCPQVANYRQIDNDGDGAGLFCDGDELHELNGMRENADIVIGFELNGLERPVEFPVFPCNNGTILPPANAQAPAQDEFCPDWLGNEFHTNILLEFAGETNGNPAFEMRVVNSQGEVVSYGALEDGVHRLTLYPEPEFFFQPPAALGLAPISVQTAGPYRGDSYTVQLVPLVGAENGASYSGRLRLQTFTNAERSLYLPLLRAVE